MKTITYLFLCALILSPFANTSAQSKSVTFGIRAGVNFSKSSTTVDDISYGLNGKDAKTGIQLGMTADFQISESFYFQSGLSFTTKGVVFKDEDSGIGGIDPNTRRYRDSKVNLLYLQLPIMGAYKAKVSSNTKLVVFAGPYFAYGVGGKIKFDSSFSSSGGYLPDNEDLNSFGERKLKRFDLGLGSGIGLEYKNYCLSLGYEWGLSNINRDSYDSDIVILFHREYKNRNASLTLGYKF